MQYEIIPTLCREKSNHEKWVFYLQMLPYATLINVRNKISISAYQIISPFRTFFISQIITDKKEYFPSFSILRNIVLRYKLSQLFLVIYESPISRRNTNISGSSCAPLYFFRPPSYSRHMHACRLYVAPCRTQMTIRNVRRV